jgi:hypothetical protein
VLLAFQNQKKRCARPGPVGVPQVSGGTLCRRRHVTPKLPFADFEKKKKEKSTTDFSPTKLPKLYFTYLIPRK